MAFDITIVGGSLIVTDETDSKIIFDAPKRDHYFVNDELTSGFVQIYDTNGENLSQSLKFGKPIAEVKIEGVGATEALVRTFQSDNLGKVEAGGASNHSGLVLDDGTNPHGTTSADVGLSSVNNTSDLNKPISTATQTALDGKKDDFTENTAFNKNFGTVAGTVLEGDTVLGGGDMLKSVYDPTGIESDAFDYENATGITQITGTQLTLTLPGTTNDFNPTGFLNCNYLRLDMLFDRDFTGFIAPPAGVERIIRGVNVSDKKIKFKNNDSASLAANRLLLRDYSNKDCRKGEPFAFKYDHISSRWRPFVRIG
jgi:hypothetical protein